MRISLAADLGSRAGVLTKDPIMRNAIMESRGEDMPARFRKRPGITTASTPTDKLALLYGAARTEGVSETAGSVVMGDPSLASIYAMAVPAPSDGAKIIYSTWSGSAWSAWTLDDGPLSGTLAYGAAQLDGYFFVLTATGKLFNSFLGDPTLWGSLDYLSISADGADAVAIVRYQNYLIAFTSSAGQAYYNAGNPTGSILGLVANGNIDVGCVRGRSISVINDKMFWLGKGRELGVGVYLMVGFQSKRISTPDVDRIINADDLATVYGTCVSAGGHQFYLLTLVTTGITLAYDMDVGAWGVWTFLTRGSSKSVSSLTRSGTTVTVVTSSSHGFSDGDPIEIAGATPTDYNAIWQVSYVSTTSFTFEVTGSPSTPATGTILAYPYTESYFPFVRSIGSQNAGVLLKTTGTTWYKLSDAIYRDDGVPINCFARSQKLDAGNDYKKVMSRITVVGDTVSDYPMMRWSDDDSATFATYRRVDMSRENPMLRRCGSFRKRSIELRHVGNNALGIDSLELEVANGQPK